MALTPQYQNDTVHLRDNWSDQVSPVDLTQEDTVHLYDDVDSADVTGGVGTLSKYQNDEVHLYEETPIVWVSGQPSLAQSTADTVHLWDDYTKDVVVTNIIAITNDTVHLYDEVDLVQVVQTYTYQRNINVSFGETKDIDYREVSHRFRWTNYNGIAVPDLNYKDLKEPIVRIMPAPSFLQFKYDNSFLLFTRNTINRFILTSDVSTGQWRAQTDNLIEEFKDLGLMHAKTLVLAGETLFGQSEKGVWKWNKNGMELISKDIINIDDVGDDEYMAFYNSIRNQYILHKQTLAVGEKLYSLDKGAIVASAEKAAAVDIGVIGETDTTAKVVTANNQNGGTYDDDEIIVSTIDKTLLSSVEGLPETVVNVRRSSTSIFGWEDDKFLYCYTQVAIGGTAIVVGTVSGTTITLHTPVLTDLTVIYRTSIARLNGTTKFVVFGADASGMKYQVGTVAGNVITLGAVQTWISGGVVTSVQAKQIETNRLLITHHQNLAPQGNKYTVAEYPGTGDVLTFGTSVDPGFIANASYTAMTIASATRAICAQWVGTYFGGGAYDLGVYPVAVDDMTVTIGTPTQLAGVNNSGTRPIVMSDGTDSGFMLVYSDYSNSQALTVIYGYANDTVVTLLSYTLEVATTDDCRMDKEGIPLTGGLFFVKWAKYSGALGYQQVWGRIIDQTRSYAYHIDKGKWTTFDGLNILDIPITLAGGSLDKNYNVWIDSDLQLQQYPGTSYCLAETKIETKNFYIKKGVFQRWIVDFVGSGVDVTTRVNRVVNDIETQVEDKKSSVVPNEIRQVTLAKSRGRTMSILVEGANIIRNILIDIKMWGEK